MLNLSFKHKFWKYFFKFLFLSGLVIFLLSFAVLLFIRIQFARASINQIVFHLLFLDSAQTYHYIAWIIGLGLVVLFFTLLIYKKPFFLFFLLVLFAEFLYLWNPSVPKVSNIREDKYISVPKQIFLSLQHTVIFKQLVVPEIRKPVKPKNLILIFAESIESNFDDTLLGENLIVHLSNLAKQHTTIKGYKSINGTNWTIASNVATL